MHRLILALAIALGALAGEAGAAPYVSSVLELPGAGSGFAVEIEDVTADGRADVVVAGRDTDKDPAGRVWIYPGDGAGGLGSPREEPVGTQPHDLEVADVTGDGRPEILVLGGERVHVLGAGEVEVAAAESFAVGDVGGDGRPDLVLDKVFGGGQVLAGDGSGGFAPSAATFPVEGCISGPGDVLLGDLDRSGTLDVAAVNFCRATVTFGLGSGGAFTAGTPVHGATYAAALGDLDADGVLDLIGTRGGRRAGRISTWRGAGDGTYWPVRTGHDRHGFFDVSIADADGDGRSDVIASQSFDAGPAYEDRGFTVLGGDGAGGFTAQLEARLALRKSVYDLDTGDLDGDGRADAAGVLNYDADRGQLAILRRVRLDEPLRAARLSRAALRIGGRASVRVDVSARSRVSVEVVPQGGSPIVLAARTARPGTTTLRFRLARTRRGQTRLKPGRWQLRVAAVRRGVTASRRLPFTIG